MIPEIIKQWEENKHKLEEYFRTTVQSKYSNYSDIVKRVFELVINDDDDNVYDYEKLRVLDDGDYQGTQIFIAVKNCYQPSTNDYLVTHNSYGSCSGCDTLQAIHDYNNDVVPDEEQIKDYMTLALHLVQRMKKL